MVNKKSFALDYVTMIVNEFQKNKPVGTDTKYLIPPDERTLFNIHNKIVLTSISENKVTFLFAGTLKDFATLRIPDPLNIYVTVIPSNLPTEGVPAGHNHYTGLISNTSEKEKMELRKLVNLLIKLNLDEESPLILKSVKELTEDGIESKSLELEIIREEQKKAYNEDNEDDDEGLL